MAKKRKRAQPSAPAKADATKVDGAAKRDRAAKPEAAGETDADAQRDALAKMEPAAKRDAAAKSRGGGNRGPRSARAAAPAAARDPVFWFGFEIAWAKLVLARFVVFTLLAIDAFLQVRHAARWGSTDFNVGQLPFLGALAPGRAGYEVAQLVLAYLFVLVACGVATRALVPIGAAIYAWLYFTSQLDSYQHHYLVAIVLVIASFVPWDRPKDARPDTPVRSWAVRLLLVQLAIVYLWAAISKMHPAWVDGRTLATQLTGAVRSAADTVGLWVVAVQVIAIELALAATVWWRRAWPIAAPLGIAFHLMILATDFEIGLFAYLMLGFYILVVPDRVWIALAESAPATRARALLRRLIDGTSWALWAIAIAAGFAIAWVLRLENAMIAEAIAVVVPIALAVRAAVQRQAPVRRLAIAHVAALGLWLAGDRVSDVAADYYKYWGGAQRRLGDLAQAEYAYRRYTSFVDDEYGNYHLGRILLSKGRDEGVHYLQRAQRFGPKIARAFVEEAQWLQRLGRTAEAIEKAKQAVAADPSDAAARTLLDSLSAP